METIINNKLKHYIQSHNVIKEDQSGFTPNQQTLEHILHLEQDIRVAQAQKQYTLAIFIDFSKAFDMVWHNGLIKKLQENAIHGRIQNFIHLFLKDRQIIIKTHNTLSDPYPLENGTPQGSIISSTLFNFMINDIFPDKWQEISTAKFADDISFWVSSTSIYQTTIKTQRMLNHIQTWSPKCKKNLLAYY